MTLGIFHSCTFVIHFQLYVRPLSSNHIRRRACEDPSYPDPEGDGSAIGYNVAPSQKILAIRFNPQTRARSLDALQWGLIPY
jgi:putative SOS response-associated peptidase YedK